MTTKRTTKRDHLNIDERFDRLIAEIEDGTARAEFEASCDPEWFRQYGEAAWEASLVGIGYSSPRPGPVPAAEETPPTSDVTPDSPDMNHPLPRRADGLVHCCAELGWVTEAVAFDHRWETSRAPGE